MSSTKLLTTSLLLLCSYLVGGNLRIMTFNIWVSGTSVHNGLLKIAKHILLVNPDIVALQCIVPLGNIEVHVANHCAAPNLFITFIIGLKKYTPRGWISKVAPGRMLRTVIWLPEIATEKILTLRNLVDITTNLQEVDDIHVMGNLTKLLGHPWVGIHHSNRNPPDTGILTRHELHLHSYTETSHGIGVRILVDSWFFVNFWSVHFDYLSYGPYAAYNKLVNSMTQILAGENPKRSQGRQENAEDVRNNPRMVAWRRKSDIVPVILCGDFNSPSHLDWTEELKNQHGGWAVTWPATKIMEEMGFIDSFRKLYPDPQQNPGYTWSTVNKFNPEWDYTIPEPQDRIDFIFYQGGVSPIRSFTYAGSEPLKPIPDHWENDYPSDHYAVITDFEVNELP